MEPEYWNNTDEDGDRMRRRQAEVLVLGELPIASALGFAVRTEAAAAIVVAKTVAAGIDLPVLVRPGFYYVGKP